jgi:hypothetical protein
MSERLLRLRVRCDACGSTPPIRVTPKDAERYRDADPKEFVKNVQCFECMRRRRKITYIDITAEAYQRAS